MEGGGVAPPFENTTVFGMLLEFFTTKYFSDDKAYRKGASSSKCYGYECFWNSLQLNM